MQKFMRLSAIFVVLMLALAACSSDGGDVSEEPSGSEPAASEPTAQDPTAVCDADAVGCVEVADGDPIRIASALSITGDTSFLGNDSNYGIEIAIQDRPEVVEEDDRRTGPGTQVPVGEGRAADIHCMRGGVVV